MRVADDRKRNAFNIASRLEARVIDNRVPLAYATSARHERATI